MRMDDLTSVELHNWAMDKIHQTEAQAALDAVREIVYSRDVWASQYAVLAALENLDACLKGGTGTVV